jgi:hypothetical protein
MIVLGLLLMLACAGLAADAVIENTNLVSGTTFDRAITDVSLGTVFVAGTILGLVFAIGLAMLVGGLGRSARKRRERNEPIARDRDAYPEEATTTTSAGSGRHRLTR